MSQSKTLSPTPGTEPADLSLEIIILLIFGLFMALFGLLLPGIQRGALPYAQTAPMGSFWSCSPFRPLPWVRLLSAISAVRGSSSPLALARRWPG